jgi:predicted Co/Zn/Cd cation transporter (cation efflux family)
MATINLGGNQVTYSFGALIALIVLTVCIVLAIMGQPLTPLQVLGLIAALALSRLC